MAEKTFTNLEKLCAHLGDDLSGEECRKILIEVDNCPDCSLILNELTGTIELFRNAMPKEKLPDDILRRTITRLNLADHNDK
jgi:hypothetical protein